MIMVPDSKQYTCLSVDQNGMTDLLVLTESMAVIKFVKVSVFVSYLDKPIAVPIQILRRLSSFNANMLPEFIAPRLSGPGMYFLKRVPSKRLSSPSALPIHKNPLSSFIIILCMSEGSPSFAFQ